MRRRIAIGALLLVAGSSELGFAADPRYPDWPCTQAKVPEISLAAVWAGPSLEDVNNKWKDDAKVSALVTKLAARRTSLEDAQKLITEFLAGPAADKATTGKLLFAGLFDSLNAQRTSVMNGLERITRKQRDAADKIRADVAALHALQSASPPDQPKIDELSNQMIWQTRIFEDRQRVVKFVCEVPTAIDQRLFALSRMIQQEIE
jgi:Spy/CpxP family protein refolding chaperone